MAVDDDAIGRNLQRIRKQADLSQAQLADLVGDIGLDGFYPQTITKIERGTRSLKLTEAVVLAGALGCELDALAGIPGGAHTAVVATGTYNRLATAETEVKTAVDSLDHVRKLLQGLRAAAAEQVITGHERMFQPYRFDENGQRIDDDGKHPEAP